MEQKNSLLPPPEILEKYQQLGINEDLVKLIKIEQEHRHKLQNKYLLNYRLGQTFSFVLCLFFLYIIFDLVKFGYKIEAYIILTVFVFLTLSVTILLRINNKIILRKKNSISRRNNNMNNTYNQKRKYTQKY